MVSNTLHLSLDELVQTLDQLRADHADDPEYQAWRAALPADWPL